MQWEEDKVGVLVVVVVEVVALCVGIAVCETSWGTMERIRVQLDVKVDCVERSVDVWRGRWIV